VGAHNHSVGQESNVLTLAGVHQFLKSPKMQGEALFAEWIHTYLLPRITCDPLAADHSAAFADLRILAVVDQRQRKPTSLSPLPLSPRPAAAGKGA
jgi:hypothetical protein